MTLKSCPPSCKTYHTLQNVLDSERMASYGDLPGTIASSSTMEHSRQHVMKLTRNLLVLQKAGMSCDIILQCKDGIITAHSGTDTKQYPQNLWQVNQFIQVKYDYVCQNYVPGQTILNLMDYLYTSNARGSIESNGCRILVSSQPELLD